MSNEFNAQDLTSFVLGFNRLVREGVLVKPAKAAQIMGISRQAVYNKISKGTLDSLMIGRAIWVWWPASLAPSERLEADEIFDGLCWAGGEFNEQIVAGVWMDPGRAGKIMDVKADTAIYRTKNGVLRGVNVGGKTFVFSTDVYEAQRRAKQEGRAGNIYLKPEQTEIGT